MRHGEARDEWRAEQWADYQAATEAGEAWESPCYNSMLAGGEGWRTLHTIEGYPPNDCPAWCWSSIHAFFTMRRTGHLPYSGGFQEQPSRLMGAFKILAGALDTIEASQKMADEFHNSDG